MNVESVIEQLGGEASVAAAFGLTPKAVEQWTRRKAIPGRWHLPVLRIARERGVELSEDDLLSTTSRK